ncbi:MAG: hypothetical protein ACK4SY_10245, partial [Pyrobaculum sp.]
MTDQSLTYTLINVSKAIEDSLRNNMALAKKIVDKIWTYAQKVGYEKLKIMDFCGTHEWTVTHFGLRSLMPPNIELVAGPGWVVMGMLKMAGGAFLAFAALQFEVGAQRAAEPTQMFLAGFHQVM